MEERRPAVPAAARLRERGLGTTAPESDPVLQRMLATTRTQLADGPLAAERRVDLVAAIGFGLAAIAMAVLIEAPRPLDPALALALVVAYALASRVEFAIGSGWVVPTQLVFVPMLFLLPTEAVPLLVAAALVLGRLPDYATGAVHAGRVLPRIAESWYAIWPALVLSLTGATSPELADWPIFLAAFAAQLGCDAALTIARERLTLRIPARRLLAELRAVYLVDALLTPAGFLAALAAADTEWGFLALLPLIGLIAVFAREREARIESALTLSAAYRGTAQLLGEVLANSHEYTGSHSRSVVVIAHQVGERLGLEPETLREIEFGALLHDVGKLAVPSEIINKPAALTEAEMAVMRMHTLEGERMLDRIGGMLGEVGEVVRSHHEHFDGSGYPDGLRGERIPIAARVIACCDAFSAMITDRPYRRAMPVAAAIAELRENAGTQFDPRVVAALVEIVESWQGEPRVERPGEGAEDAVLDLVD